MNYILRNWSALTLYVGGGAEQLDVFRSDRGGRTAALLRSFVASRELVKIDPFAWFTDVLSRIAAQPITMLEELLGAGLRLIILSLPNQSACQAVFAGWIRNLRQNCGRAKFQLALTEERLAPR